MPRRPGAAPPPSALTGGRDTGHPRPRTPRAAGSPESPRGCFSPPRPVVFPSRPGEPPFRLSQGRSPTCGRPRAPGRGCPTPRGARGPVGRPQPCRLAPRGGSPTPDAAAGAEHPPPARAQPRETGEALPHLPCLFPLPPLVLPAPQKVRSSPLFGSPRPGGGAQAGSLPGALGRWQWVWRNLPEGMGRNPPGRPGENRKSLAPNHIPGDKAALAAGVDVAVIALWSGACSGLRLKDSVQTLPMQPSKTSLTSASSRGNSYKGGLVELSPVARDGQDRG